MGWVTISALATAVGTLVLAAATFASVKSANRAARVAERALFAGLRPLLVPSRREDPAQRVGFVDLKWFKVPGGGAVAEATDEAIYLAIALRNASSGIAVLHGWRLFVGRVTNGDPTLDPATFTRLSRDLYIPAGDIGFWQGAYRDPSTAEFVSTREAIATRSPLTIDLLYGDLEGGQRIVSRFVLDPREADDDGFIVSIARHWNIDRPDPR